MVATFLPPFPAPDALLPQLRERGYAVLAPQDVAALAASCANCHGPDGRSGSEIPSLRGSQAAHLTQRMLDFKAGKAADATVMTRLMKGYADEEIHALADWFAASSATHKEKR